MTDDEPISHAEKTQLIAGMFHSMRSKAKGRNYDPDGVVMKAAMALAKKQREGEGRRVRLRAGLDTGSLCEGVFPEGSFAARH